MRTKSLSISFNSDSIVMGKYWHRCFPVNFTKFLRTPFVTEHLRATASAAV